MRNRSDYAPEWWSLHAGQLAPGQTAVLPVLTGSMAPQLPPGSEIVIRAVAARDCRVGDIIVFRRGVDLMDLTAHRLLIAPRLPGLPQLPQLPLYEKGDANPRGGWIRPGQVAGVVIRSQGESGTLADFESPASRDEARSIARRQIVADLRERVPAPLRRAVRAIIGRR